MATILAHCFYMRVNTNSCCSQHYILYEHFKYMTFWYMQHVNGILIREYVLLNHNYGGNLGRHLSSFI